MVSASSFASPDKNSLSLSANGFLPRVAVLPLCEDEASAEILVREGDVLKEGDVVARGRGLFVHSSVPGVVRKIQHQRYSNCSQGMCAHVALGGSFSFLGKKRLHQEWMNYDGSTIEYLLRENGVTNTFAKNVPVFTQMKKIRGDSSSALVLRLYDDDPSRLTESFVAGKFLPEVLEGAAILARAFGASLCVIAFPEGEEDFFRSGISEALEKNALFPSPSDVLAVAVSVRRYPCGSMHDIVSAVRRSHKGGGVPRLGKKDLFVDSTTALNAFNAIALGMPVLTTFVHVTGDCLNSAALLNVRIGTTFRDIAEQCGGFKRRLSKIIVNGIMLGHDVASLDIPISRGVKSVEFVPAGQVRLYDSVECVRCGNCRKICPAHLWPGDIYRAARLPLTGGPEDKIVAESSLLCSGCALCSSVCPSRLPLSQTIDFLKDSYNER